VSEDGTAAKTSGLSDGAANTGTVTTSPAANDGIVVISYSVYYLLNYYTTNISETGQ
jgi:hypothetical protein